MSTVQTAAKPKQRPNLTSVIPAPVEPPKPGFDTTTPMDMSVLPFTQMYLPTWGAWLLARLQEHWPHLTQFNYAGAIAQHMRQDGAILIRAKRALLLAVATRESFEPRPIIDVVFCFKFHPDDEDENKDVRLLFRRVDEWAKNMGARYIRLSNLERFDMTPSRTAEIMGSKEASVLLKDLDK